MEKNVGKKFITSWDDDADENLRLAELINKYKLPAMFYLTNKASWQMIKQLDSYNTIEIGGHTVNHPEDMKLLNHKDLTNEVEGNKKYLEKTVEYIIRDFCYPGGRYNCNTVEAIKRAGYYTARTTLVHNIKKPKDLFRIKPTIHAYPNRKEYKKNWVSETYDYFDKVFLKDEGDYFHLWGHSLEIEKYNLWADLENLFKYFKLKL